MGFGGAGGEGGWLAGGAGLAGGGNGDCWWHWRPGIAAKGDAAQDSAVFFNT